MTDQYRPMNALNVYMEPYFRKDILEKVFNNLNDLPGELRKDFLGMIKSDLKISGFRNPMAAPRALLLRESAALFENDSNFVKATLAAWAILFKDKHKKITDLAARLGITTTEQADGYPDPENAFLEGWPDGMTYSRLFAELGEDDLLSDDETSLLTILLTGHLPGANATDKKEE